jgi:hypothetical protein
MKAPETRNPIRRERQRKSFSALVILKEVTPEILNNGREMTGDLCLRRYEASKYGQIRKYAFDGNEIWQEA